MKHISRRCYIGLAGGLIAFLLACHISPGFARRTLGGVSLPVMAALHRLTAGIPFPVAEVIALGLACALAFALLAAALRAVGQRSAEPLGRWLAGALWAALAIAAALALLWGPARALPEEPLPQPDGAHLAWLCEALIEQLNGAALDFPEASESLGLAPAVAGVGQVVKAARYPEWMDAAHVWGLFVPLTGEALADAAAPAPLIPFTAVHELTHLAGIADEGAANVAAWRRCVEAGGAFADSARLWALRYAMGLLRQTDGDAWAKVRAKMEGPLARTFQQCGGEIVPGDDRPPALPGLSLGKGDYGALVGYLAGKISGIKI